MDQKKALLAIATLAWSGFVIAAYFVVQKPLAMQVADRLMALAWTLVLTSVLLLNALAIGAFTLERFLPDAGASPAWLALAGGIGLGELGLLGFVFAALGVNQFWILLTAQILLLGWFVWQGTIQRIFPLIENSITQIKSSALLVPAWMRWAALLAFTLTFFMTLLPPADAFDALLYHLTVPERWLADGGLRAYDFPHYWFPGLVEGVYFWGLGVGSEIVPQQIHFAWAVFTAMLLWDWTRRLWGDQTAWWAILFLVSMPSLWTLAGWAYTDLALIFFGVAMLYTLSLGREGADARWWNVAAINAGMAMGVKYTSFVMPVTGVILISAWTFGHKKEWLAAVFKFALISVAASFVWYLRNWIWMGNPIYPFLFGGRYWDAFRSDWFATPGTGSGWDLKALLLLPLTITLGYQDINFIDADIGPLLLLALPLAVWAMTRKKDIDRSHRTAFSAIGFFTLLSAAFWIYGYITTRDLWQTRLLLPAIVPFVIPAAAGITALRHLDTQRFRLFFIVSVIAAAATYVNLFDMTLILLARNPLATAAGLVTRQAYLEKYQPGYTAAVQMVSQTPPDSRIYALFEPRSYGMTRSVQPDPILDNFSHDVYLYVKPEDILTRWQRQGYTHVLLQRRAVESILGGTADLPILEETVDLLKLVSISPDGSYELLEIAIQESAE